MRLRCLSMMTVMALAGCGGLKTTMENSWTGATSPIQKEIQRLLETRDRVSIAVITTVQTAYSAESIRAGGGDPEQWRQGMRSGNTGATESLLLQSFGGNKKFQLVDRSTLDKITDEWFLSAQSNVSDETRLKIGALTGATHLLVMTISRAPAGPHKQNDIAVTHLIDAETGQVMAAQVQTAHNTF